MQFLAHRRSVSVLFDGQVLFDRLFDLSQCCIAVLFEAVLLKIKSNPINASSEWCIAFTVCAGCQFSVVYVSAEKSGDIYRATIQIRLIEAKKIAKFSISNVLDVLQSKSIE